MKKRFLRLWNELRGENAQQEYQLLCAYYSQKHRAYHNLIHISHMLSEFDKVKNLAANRKALELAIWYHDIENYPWRKDNEERSVQVLYGLKDRAGINHKILDYAANLILITKHTQEPKTIDEQIIMDCDISSFGKSSSEFNLSNSNIRKEYAFVKLDVYNQKRDEILKKFLDKKNIYYTSKLHKAYESNARENIQRTIKELEMPECR